MELYVVVDKMQSGRGALGVFSSYDKAKEYMDNFVSKTKCVCEIEKSFIRGDYQSPNHVFVAHTYDPGYDIHILEGIYSELSQAQRAAGRKGEIIEFSIDSPEQKQISMNH